MAQKIFVIHHADVNRRIDHFLSYKLTDISRSRIKKLILDGFVTVNKKKTKPHCRISEGDEIYIEIPLPEKLYGLEPEPVPLDILYEDRHIIVINKPSGMAVHPAAGRRSGTLAGALLFHCKDLSGIGGAERPGIVHRLDKDTSGVIICAKNDASHISLSSQFRERKVKKIYLALAAGQPKKDKGIIEADIGRHIKDRKKISTVTKRGRTAVTEYEVKERFKKNALLHVRIFTGRTHQIRVHLASQGYPVMGDKIYGKGGLKVSGVKAEHLMLHAKTIGFEHPYTKKYMERSAPLPEYFNNILDMLRGQCIT